MMLTIYHWNNKMDDWLEFSDICNVQLRSFHPTDQAPFDLQ